MLYEHTSGRIYDMITGDMVNRGEMILDTGIRTITFNPVRNQRTMFIKESTIVWLAEKAGYTLIKRDAGDSGDTKVVDGSDASVGGGEAPARKSKTGGRKAAK
jgi:hypothetical protein